MWGTVGFPVFTKRRNFMPLFFLNSPTGKKTALNLVIYEHLVSTKILPHPSRLAVLRCEILLGRHRPVSRRKHPRPI